MGRVLSSLASHSCLTGEPERAIELSREALAIASALDDFSLRVGPSFNLAWAFLTAGDFRRAVEVYRENIAALDGRPAAEPFGEASLPAVYSRAFLAWALAELGEFDAALAPAGVALRIADTANRPFGQLQASFGLGLLHLRRGEFARAIPSWSARWRSAVSRI